MTLLATGAAALLYGGVRPWRVRRLVNVEGFGMPTSQPEQACERFAQWIDELKALHRGEKALKPFASAAAAAQRLLKTSPRLSADKADWIARQWAAPDSQGQWRVRGDPAQTVVNAQLYRADEVIAIYRRIAAPALWVRASDNTLDKLWNGRLTMAEHVERLANIPGLVSAGIDDSGHMLHHERPLELAQLIERFTA